MLSMMKVSDRIPRLLSLTLRQAHKSRYLNPSTIRKCQNSRGITSLIYNKELWTVPNMITISRILSSPGLTYAVALDMKEIALGGCIIFGLSDWLDGYIARTYNQQTALGAFLDPLADKIFIGALVIGLTSKGLFPLPLATVIIGRDVLLVAAAFTMRVQERPDGAPFFDTSESATFEIVPSHLSKVNTACQFLLLVTSLGNFALDLPLDIFVEPLWWITAVTTVGSGLSYLDGSGLKRIPKRVTVIRSET